MGDQVAVDLHSTTDASVWAREFVRILRASPETADPYDEGFMLGWFANAMMAQYDELANNPATLRGLLAAASTPPAKVKSEPVVETCGCGRPVDECSPFGCRHPYARQAIYGD